MLVINTGVDTGGGSGTITFKGDVSGKMTISACPGGGISQLAVNVDGQGRAARIRASSTRTTSPSSARSPPHTPWPRARPSQRIRQDVHRERHQARRHHERRHGGGKRICDLPERDCPRPARGRRIGEKLLVARGGVEPPTSRFSVGRSYQLSYLARAPDLSTDRIATPTGLEPATSAVTGRRSNQLSYGARGEPGLRSHHGIDPRSGGNSNPRTRVARKRATYRRAWSYLVPPTGFEPVLPP